MALAIAKTQEKGAESALQRQLQVQCEVHPCWMDLDLNSNTSETATV